MKKASPLLRPKPQLPRPPQQILRLPVHPQHRLRRPHPRGLLHPKAKRRSKPALPQKMASEMNGDTEGGSRAIQRLTGIVQANVVYLGTQIDPRKYADIHAAANAES